MRAALIALSLALLSDGAGAQQTDRAPPTHASMMRLVLDRDLALFLTWLEGRFDNDRQVFFDRDLMTPEHARNSRFHSIFRRVDLPVFGPNVFYVEQYSDNDPARVGRQRIYVFSPDYAEGAIKLTIHVPKEPAALLQAWRVPAKLAGLTPAQTTIYPGCDVWWKRQGNQFIGHMKPGACRIGSERSRRPIVDTEHFVLTQDEIWVLDAAPDARGAYVYGRSADVHSKMRRVRPFECWASVLRGARHGDSGEGQDSWYFTRDIWLHDQGGEAVIRTDETPARDIRLRLRRVEWPYGANRPSLTLYVHEGENERAASYVWAEYDAERLGINLRWLQASCTHAPQRLFEGR
jgi:hypothetical protein